MKSEYSKEHSALLGKWKVSPLHKEQVFIEDGIINVDNWFSAEKKILFMLKEAYGEDADWSLVNIINNVWGGPKYKIFWVMSYWLYLLNKIDKNNIPLFPSTEKEYNECRDYLLKSAIVNIKKSSGKSNSNYEDLIEYAKKDRQYLLKQIKLINPEIIICGYTKEFFDIIWDKDIKKLKNTDYIYESDGTLIIDFWHPANQFPEKLCYYSLGALYQKIL